MKYQKHIFVCINERDSSSPRKSCGEKTGLAIAQKFKDLIQEHKLKMSVRAQRASCFDLCEHGPTIVVYPEGVFYKQISIKNVSEIFESHILNNIPVERLRLNFPQK